jgi:uncharacterized protein
MRKAANCLLAVVLCTGLASSAMAATNVRISQVYGGNGATWNQDYVELYNNSTSPVNIGGWSLQYGSATTTTGFSTVTVFQIPSGRTIPPCGYFLIGLATATTGAALPVPTDASTNVINASSVSGKVLLINAAPAPVGCLGNVNPEPANWLDEVGYGTGAGLCYEAAAAPSLSTTTTLVRAGAGATDNDNNSTDFTAPSSLANPPRNSSSPPNPACVAGACCLRNTSTGACSILSPAGCQAVGGVYMGNFTTCSPPQCATDAKRSTWGQLKTIYR